MCAQGRLDDLDEEAINFLRGMKGSHGQFMAIYRMGRSQRIFKRLERCGYIKPTEFSKNFGSGFTITEKGLARLGDYSAQK